MYGSRKQDSAFSVRRNFAASLSILSSAVLSACTVVRVHSPDGEVSIERRLLSTGVIVEDEVSSRTVQSNGLGIFADHRSFVLGWHSIDLALLGPDCRAVLWLKSPNEYQKVAPLVNEAAGVCVANQMPEKNEGLKG